MVMDGGGGDDDYDGDRQIRIEGKWSRERAPERFVKGKGGKITKRNGDRSALMPELTSNRNEIPYTNTHTHRQKKNGWVSLFFFSLFKKTSIERSPCR